MNSSFLKKYTVIDKIGEGSFSEVLKCEKKQTDAAYAAKCLKKNFKNISEVYQSAEIVAMKKLKKHENIVYLFEFHYDITKGKVVLIFELMDLSMYEFIKLRRRCFPESKVKHYLYQIVKGLHHLHSNDLFHRDLKPENILVKLHGNEQPANTEIEQIKLADLGSVRAISSKPPFTEYISTRWYRSPECLLTVGEYGPKMDIWAAGCVFYEMLTLKPLFPGSNEVDQLFKIHLVLGSPTLKMLNKFKRRSRNFTTFPKQVGTGLRYVIRSISEDGLNVLRLMLQYDPDMRINTARLLNNKFFDDLRFPRVSLKDHKINAGDFRSLSLNSTINQRRDSKITSSTKCSHDGLLSKTHNDMKIRKLFKASSSLLESKIPLRKPILSKTNISLEESNNNHKKHVPKSLKGPTSKTSKTSMNTKKSKTTSYLSNYVQRLAEAEHFRNGNSREYESKSFFTTKKSSYSSKLNEDKIGDLLSRREVYGVKKIVRR